MLEPNGPGPDPALFAITSNGARRAAPGVRQAEPIRYAKRPGSCRPVTNWGQDEVRALTHDCRRRRGAVSVRWCPPARHRTLAALAAIAAVPVPAASVQPSPSRSPALGVTCALGYADGSRTFPDTPDGLAAAQRASGGLEPHMALHVSVTNTGTLVGHLHALAIEFDDPAIPETIQPWPLNVSASLAPGASWDHWQDMGTPDKPEPLAGVFLHMASESALQRFTCRILGWR